MSRPGAHDTGPFAPLVMQVPSRRDALELAQQRVSGFLAGHGVEGKPLFACELVLEELLANLILHAFDDGQDHLIDVRVELEPGAVVLQFSDEGPAFDPTLLSDPPLPATIDEARPGGLGLFLVRRWAQRLDYRREGDRNRLSVSIANPGHAAAAAAGSSNPP